MNIALTKNTITESRDVNNVSYIIEDPQMFLPTGYKVLQSQERNGFIRCAKVTHNGKTKLVYLASKYKSLSSLLPSLGPDAFMVILTNLLTAVIEVKNNGFLHCENLDISFDKIFVDCNNYMTYLIYLPINIENSPKNYAIFENDLKTNIVNAVNTNHNIAGPETFKIISEITRTSPSVESLLRLVQVVPPAPLIMPKGNPAAAGTLVMEAVNAPVLTTFVINKSVFVIGKSADNVDGVVSFNKAVSRVHCKFVMNNGSYSLVDMGSANGTYLNGKKLAMNQQTPVKPGDRIRLANSEFVLKNG